MKTPSEAKGLRPIASAKAQGGPQDRGLFPARQGQGPGPGLVLAQ